MDNLIDFSCSIAIIEPSPITADMVADLPSIYDASQNTPLYTALFGVGQEFENAKRRIKQLQANNTLYSPSVQSGYITVNGSGKYIVEFDLPFVQPPLDVSISGASVTDVFVEFVSRYSMVINVQTEISDSLYYYINGFVGAASEEYLGDALQLNFGDLYGFDRAGDSIIDDSFVAFYEQTNVFISANNILPLQNVSVVFDNNGNVVGNPVITVNAPPINSFYLKGLIKPSSVLTTPHSSHELVSQNGTLIALVDATTISNLVSAYYPTTGNNPYKTDASVYIIGNTSTYIFDRWNQPSYTQEVFRADNQYRRILSAINKAIFLGPSIAGLANMIEALISQPFIPAEFWQQSDYRIFANTPGTNSPKYLTYTENASGLITAVDSATQIEGYPSIPPVVEVRRVNQQWSADSITYNNKPTTQSLDVYTAQQIQTLNIATRFDVTNEIIRQLRLGLDEPTGGVINWNYAAYTNNIPATGSSLYEQYNYVFLNEIQDNPSSINLYWHAQQFNSNGPTGYRTFGPLQVGKDYFVIGTNKFQNAQGEYALPSELIQGYYADSTIPYADGSTDSYGNTMWLGATLVSNGIIGNNLPQLPTYVFQINLIAYTIQNNSSGIATKMPTNIYDYILYTYSQVSFNSQYITGNFVSTTTAAGTAITSYYDSNASSSLQPFDSPYVGSSGSLLPNALAQSPFSKFITATGYEYVLDMRSGSAQFNKTVLTQNIKMQNPLTTTNLVSSAPGILVLQVSRTLTGQVGNPGQIGSNQFLLTGKVAKIMDSSGTRYFPFYYGDYVLLDENDNPIAILSNTSIVNFSQFVGTTQTVLGFVLYTLWDTRIAVSEYRTDSPIFQVVSNDPDLQFQTLVPDINDNALNLNFFVEIFGLPIGNLQNITATWTFNIRTTNNNNTSYVSTAMGFPDRLDINGNIIRGIMSTYCGLALQENNIDPDGATYSQGYTSGSYNAYFLNYSDYINDIGTSLTPFGDKNTLNTLTNPVLATRIPGQPISGTILNFFIPNYGFISVSILPNQTFYSVGSGNDVNVIRPNNNGFALQIDGNSYAGLTFYANPQTKIVDKPTRLIADFIFESSDAQIRKKTVEIGNGGYAAWVDGAHADVVQNTETFYIAGNQFKYSGFGYDQPNNQYDTNLPQSSYAGGTYYDRNPPMQPNGDQSPAVYEADQSLNYITSIPGPLNDFGPVFRYRRPPEDYSSGSIYATPQLSALQNNYYNITPEKIAFIQFDLSSFPYDTIINTAILELYFSSGFTIKEAKDINLSLNKNKFWSNSRISGNGKTYLKTLKNADNSKYSLYNPLQNTHWRKNFTEIIIPYAFYSEPNGIEYGISNLFNFGNTNTVPQATNPIPCLEYLGYINIDEISVAGLSTAGIENTVGLTNIILSQNSLIFQINDILSFTQDTSTGKYLLLNCIDKNAGFIYANTDNCPIIFADPNANLNYNVIGTFINQNDVLPNMKVLVFPFADDLSTYFYGYCTTVLPSQQISFDDNNIAVYKNVISRVLPLYSEYEVLLLEADSYNTYLAFTTDSLDNTIQDIAY